MKHNKKAFTVVELVIVIAILAILAAVLIPTFVGLVEKANESNTLKLVKNLNTALKADMPDGKHPTMQSALDAANAFGYDLEKINKSKTDNEILWDSANDCFVYMKEVDGEMKPQYVPNSNYTELAKKDYYKYWTISNKINATYSTYLYDYTGDSNITVSTGIDVGNVTTITKITYTSNVNEARDIVIRTNSTATTLEVNAPKDTVRHYSEVGTVRVIAVDRNASYHEYGQVNTLVVNDGHVVVENNATVATMVVEKAENATVSIDNKGVINVAAVPDDVTMTGTVAVEKPAMVTLDSQAKGTGYDIGGYVKLDKDYEVSGKITLHAKSTLDLAGKSITFTSNGYLHVVNSALTIIDTVGGGKIIGTNQYPVYIDDDGIITLNGGDISCMKEGQYAVCMLATPVWYSVTATFVMNGGSINKNATSNVCGIVPFKNAEVTINGGEVYGKGEAVAISGNGGTGYGNTTITINGGLIKAENSIAVYHPQIGDLIINGGTIEGATAVYVKSGKLTVTGGTIKGTGEAAEYKYNGKGAEATGDAIVLDVCGYPGGDPSAFVISSKATITSDNAQPLVAFIQDGDDQSKIITLLDGANVAYKLFRKDSNNNITEITK